MATQTERKYTGDWLKDEVLPNSRFCRDNVTLKSTGSAITIVSGTVLGKITSGGKYVAHDPDASDGSQTAAGILYETTAVPASGDMVAPAIVRGPCIVSNDGLTWSDDTDLDQAAAIATLKTLNIIVREGL